MMQPTVPLLAIAKPFPILFLPGTLRCGRARSL